MAANILQKFLCEIDGKECYLETWVNGNSISVSLFEKGCTNEILLSKLTAIKFAKTLRTEINKIQ